MSWFKAYDIMHLSEGLYVGDGKDVSPIYRVFLSYSCTWKGNRNYDEVPLL